MAKPRIFVSSTYYDFKVVRTDIERFIRERGFEPILHEKGHVPYGNDKPLEDYCYKEVEFCDILICIIGGKFGTESKDGANSITQKELRSAVELSKQVYIFVEKGVHSEYRTYQRNKDATLNWAAVDDIRIYKFLEEIYSLPIGNPIFPFETSLDIVNILQEQWAGLFQRLLSESSRQKEVRLISDMKDAVTTLNQLVTFLTEDKRNSDLAIRQILQANHPIFTQLKSLLKAQYRLFFTNKIELSQWLSARNFKPTEEYPEGVSGPEEAFVWSNAKDKQFLAVDTHVFDESGRLRIFTPDEWKKEFVAFGSIPEPSARLASDDEVPF